MEYPKIEVKDGNVLIIMPVDALVFAAEQNPEYPKMKVLDSELFAKEFSEKLNGHQTQNSKETGLTGLQEYFDVVIGEVCEFGESIELIEQK